MCLSKGGLLGPCQLIELRVASDLIFRRHDEADHGRPIASSSLQAFYELQKRPSHVVEGALSFVPRNKQLKNGHVCAFEAAASSRNERTDIALLNLPPKETCNL